MTARLYLRSGEVPTLFGLDANRSEWALWQDMRANVDNGAGDYGRWQGRLMMPIMQGICEDHSLRMERAVTSDDAVYAGIMPPKAWLVAPTMMTQGMPALLVVSQRISSSLRDWKEPSSLPDKQRLRYQAIATAHDVEHVLVGLLIDGYSSQLYHVTTSEDRRAEIRTKSDQFIEDVRNDVEPDLDFSADAGAIRKGIAITKVVAAAETVTQILDERARLSAERLPADSTIKRVDARLKQIDTNLIHMAGTTGRLEAGNRLVTVSRDAKNVARVTIVDKAPTPLF